MPSCGDYAARAPAHLDRESMTFGCNVWIHGCNRDSDERRVNSGGFSRVMQTSSEGSHDDVRRASGE